MHVVWEQPPCNSNSTIYFQYGYYVLVGLFFWQTEPVLQHRGVLSVLVGEKEGRQYPYRKYIGLLLNHTPTTTLAPCTDTHAQPSLPVNPNSTPANKATSELHDTAAESNLKFYFCYLLAGASDYANVHTNANLGKLKINFQQFYKVFNLLNLACIVLGTNDFLDFQFPNPTDLHYKIIYFKISLFNFLNMFSAT